MLKIETKPEGEGALINITLDGKAKDLGVEILSTIDTLIDKAFESDTEFGLMVLMGLVSILDRQVDKRVGDDDDEPRS